VAKQEGESDDDYKNSEDSKDEFKWNLFLVLMFRGLLEFTGSVLYLVGLNIALNNYIN
jgi:hypothetical protein